MKTLSLSEFKSILRARVMEADSLRKLAPALGTTAQTLSRLLSKAETVPGPQLLRVLGYRRVVRYERLNVTK